jgi:hypothetical protein
MSHAFNPLLNEVLHHTHSVIRTGAPQVFRRLHVNCWTPR